MVDFTPGPWAADIALGCVGAVDNRCAKGRRIVVADTQYDTQSKHCVTTDAERDANTYLIAAAPDMFAALERAKDIIANVAPGHFPQWEAEAAAALAKASPQPMREEKETG